MQETAEDTRTRKAETFSEFFARIIVVGFCGTFCLYCSAETIRAIENNNLGRDDVALIVGAVAFGFATVHGLLRLWALSAQIVRQVFARQFALHEANSELLNSVFSSLPSRIGAFPQLLMFCGIAAVIYVIFEMSSVWGESTTATSQVCSAAAISLLPGPWVVVHWNRRHRIRSVIVGTGVVAVFLFWVAVAIGRAMDQVNFSRSTQWELAMTGFAVFLSGIVLAALVTALKIWFVFRRATTANGQQHEEIEVNTIGTPSFSEQESQNAPS